VKRQLILLICLAAFPTNALFAQAQSPAATNTVPAKSPGAESNAVPPHQVGLIDMSFVFKNYQKFNTMTASLQEEIQQLDEQAKTKVERMKQLQGQLTGGTLKEGSAEFIEAETSLMNAKSELETFKRVAQRDFLRKEADIYKTIYLEVEDAVRRYAAYYHYTLVLRFNRQDVHEAENPRDVMNGMNRQVLYFRSQDDLTDPILEYLNSEWQKQSGTSSAPSGEKTGKPRPAAGIDPAKINR
jgi:outer membrane protein